LGAVPLETVVDFGLWLVLAGLLWGAVPLETVVNFGVWREVWELGKNLVKTIL
jgi:hypothetical protein